MILGAALLMVGCTKELETKVADLQTRLDAIEQQVAANKTAIEELKKADFVSSVAKMPGDAGWTITLSNGDELALYNGKDGKDGANGAAGADGDAFFQSVTVEGDVVIFTLTDGTVITVPYVVEFALELLTDEAVIAAGETAAIPYQIKGASAQTKVYAVAGGEYTVKVDEANNAILITAPATLTAHNVLVMADRGDGKTSAKQINMAGQKLEAEVANVHVANFWGGDSFTVKVASNIKPTITTDAVWLTIEQTKAVTEYEFVAKAAPTPSCKTREGHIFVKDAAGNVVKDLVVAEGGCPVFFLNNQTNYSTWEAASTALATATADGKDIATDGSVTVYVSQDAYLDRIVLPANDAIKALNILPRPIGTPAADPTKVVIKGVTVPAGMPTIISGITIRPDGNQVISGINSSVYGTGIAILAGTNNVEVNNVYFDGTDEAYTGTTPTMIFDCGSAAGSKITVKNSFADFGGCRGVQTYGNADYTFDGNTLTNAYASYMMRIYDGTNITFTNNFFDSTNNLIDLRTGSNAHTGNVEPKVEDGKLVNDTNTYSDKVVRVYTGRFGSIYPGDANKAKGNVFCNGIPYETVSAALAGAPSGAVITIAEGEIDDNIKIPAGKTYTIKAAEGAVRDQVIINGNIEIAGSLNMSGVTLKTKAGVTNSELTVADPNSDWYRWGHNYLARVEFPASNVVFDNVHFIATDDVPELASSMSMIWISQATGVQVLNSVFDISAVGAYCPNQTHGADVVFRGNVFNGVSANGWILRVMDTTNMTIAENDFEDSEIAVQIYKDFKGTAIFGDGKEDNNIYGPAIQKAIDSPYTWSEYAFMGATVKPSTLTYNAPTTAPAKDPEIALLWNHFDDATWKADIDIDNVRNIVMNQNAMYLPSTSGHIYTLSLEDGSLVKDQPIENTSGTWGGLCGAQSLPDGTILMSTMAMNSTQKFRVYTYDGTNLTTIVDMPGEDQYRIGDKITATGTKDNVSIYAVDYKTGSANNGRYLRFDYKGEALAAPTQIVGITGMPSNASMAEMVPFADGKYYFQLEGGKDDMIITDGTEGAVAAAITLGDLNSDVNKRMTRGAKFFTAGGRKYMALIEMLGYNGGNSFGVTLHVYALPTGDPEKDLVGANAILTYNLPSTTPAGNACGGLEVVKVGTKIYIGVGAKSTGVALFEFKY